MAASAFDTLTATRALEAAGVERKHAEAIADQLRSAADAKNDQLVTKVDLKTELERFATKADLASLRSEVRWMMGFLAALILAMVGRLFGIL